MLIQRFAPPPSAGCVSLLGLEGGGISESQISASSVRYTVLRLQRWGPELARLHNKGLVNAWSSAPHDRNPWIEVCVGVCVGLFNDNGFAGCGGLCLGLYDVVKKRKKKHCSK